MDKNNKILLVSEPNQDGVFIHVRDLVLHLISKGYGVEYFYSSKRASPQLGLLIGDLRLRGVRTWDMQVSNSPCLRDIWVLCVLIYRLICGNHSIIHAHSSKAGFLVRAVRILFPRRAFFYTPHAYYSMSKRPKGPRIFFWWLERMMGRLGVTINVSEAERKFAKETLGIAEKRLIFIPNPVDYERFYPVDHARKVAVREVLGIPPEKFVVGMVGRMNFQKDPMSFFRAASLLAVNNRDFHFCYLGRGELIEDINKFIVDAGLHKRFTHIPFMGEPTCFYQALDCFVLTSRYEGAPIALLEALATNLPVVLTRYVGINESQLAQLNNVKIVEVEDVDAIAKAISFFCKKLKTGVLDDENRLFVEENFSRDDFYIKILGAYNLRPCNE